jgi:endonuclease-8
MPEGHTIHRAARDQRRRFRGEVLNVSSPQGRFRAGAKQLNGRPLEDIEAHGKHLFYHWDGHRILHVHLGLYGRFRNHRSPPPEPRGAVRLRVIGQKHAFDLVGPAACELMSPRERDQFALRLGPDPLRRDADPEWVWQRISKSRAAIGKLLLDQSVIAGVGNVFRAEALYSTNIHPERPGSALTREEFDTLWQTLTRMLKTGVKYNRIITADILTDGKSPGRLRREERLMIYKAEHCPRCAAATESWDLGARKIYACGRCQS